MRTVADETIEPVVVAPSATVQDASAAMLDQHGDAAIVLDESGICGLVTAGGVADALAAGYDVARTPVIAIADRDVLVVEADETLAEAHLQMRAAGQRLAVVVGERRRPIGLLSDPEAAP
jgi:CBS domain-containing protein